MPSKYRNVSGIFVRLSAAPTPVATTNVAAAVASSATFGGAAASGLFAPSSSVILDCGEGTYGQLFRRFGPGPSSGGASTSEARPPSLARAEVDDCTGGGSGGHDGDSLGFPSVDAALLSVGAVWISHMHADHHLGLPRIIAKRGAAVVAAAAMTASSPSGSPAAAAAATPSRYRPLLICGPSRLFDWLTEYSALDPSLTGHWRFVDAEHFKLVPGGLAEPAVPAVAAAASSLPAASPAGSPATTPVTSTTAVMEVEGQADHTSGHDGDGDVGIDGHHVKRMKLSSPLTDDDAASAAAIGGSVGGAAVGVGATGDDLAVASSATLGVANHDDDDVVCTLPQVNTAEDNGGNGSSFRGSGGGRGPVAARLYAVHIPAACGDDHLWGNSSGGNCSSPNSTLSATPATTLASHAFISSVFGALGVVALRCVQVVHCPKAYALRLDVASIARDAVASPALASTPWSLVYSGDTRPCDAVVRLGRLGAITTTTTTTSSTSSVGSGGGFELAPSPLAVSLARSLGRLRTSPSLATPSGLEAEVVVVAAPAPILPSSSGGRSGGARGCTLLIHEATFDDTEDGRIEAAAKRHSTVGEALGVAAAMRARHTLLTHFSARYPKLPTLLGHHQEGHQSSGGGQDLALPLLLPPVAQAQAPAHHQSGGDGVGSVVPKGFFRGGGAIDTTAAGAAAAAAVIGHFTGGCGGGGGVVSTYGASGVAGGMHGGEGCVTPTVFVAYDLMTVRPADFVQLPSLLPVLHALFKEDDEPDAVAEAAGLLGAPTD